MGCVNKDITSEVAHDVCTFISGTADSQKHGAWRNYHAARSRSNYVVLYFVQIARVVGIHTQTGLCTLS